MTTASANRRHAVVLGASIAGLLAARVLADRYERVSIIERDRLPNAPCLRKFVPQGAHVHGVLSRGLGIMEGLFPGLTGELVAGGAGLIGTEDVQIYIKGWRKHHDSPLKVVTLTRPFLEWTLANRVRALAGVAIADGSEAVRLEGSADCVSGVTVRNDNGEDSLTADFIVDARGRASNLADWMMNFDLQSAPHETSPLGSVYCSCLFEAVSSDSKPMALQIVKFEDKLGALVFQVEGGRVLLSVGANAEVQNMILPPAALFSPSMMARAFFR